MEIHQYRVNSFFEGELMAWPDAAAARLRLLQREWGTQDDLSDRTGIPKATLQRILAGKSDPGAERLALLVDALNSTEAYVLRGDGSAAKPIVEVGMYDIEVAAGPGRIAIDAVKPVGFWPFPQDWVAEKFGINPRLKVFRVAGDSQEPELRDGDSVMIDTASPRLREGMHVVRLDDALLIKRIQLEGKTVRLVSNNSAYSDTIVDLSADVERFEIIGKAVWAGKLL